MTTAPPETETENENELSALLSPVQPYIEKYGSKIVLALAAILVLAAAYIWWSRSSQAAAAAGWGDMATAAQAEDFADIADENPGTIAAAWARLSEAESYLSRGVKTSFSDRSASKGTFDKARDAFEQVLSMRGSSPEVRERALFGVARLEESLTGEDTSVAVQAYKELLSKFPESIFKENAEARIARLEDPEVKKFYGWFATQSPSIGDDLNLPNDLPNTPGKTDFDDLLKDLPKAGQPSAPEPGAPEAGGDAGLDVLPPADGDDEAAGAPESKVLPDPPATKKTDGSEEK